MSGITRINITSDKPTDNLGYRGKISTNHIISINKIYREIFDLEDGEEIINVEKKSMYSNMDIYQGIDVILKDKIGRVFTLQEKMLTYNGLSTVTYEKYKGSGKPGAYFYCTANYYFVAYNKNYNPNNNYYEIDEYILLDNNSLRLDDNINWIAKQNKGDRKSIFIYCDFVKIPKQHIISIKIKPFIENTFVKKINYSDSPSSEQLLKFIGL
jgi:hypothetical protein